MSDNEFEVAVKEGLVLVDFWAEWCAPCKALLPTIDAVAAERPDVKVVKVNVDESELSAKFGIRSVPTVIVFKDGKEVARQVGAVSKQTLLNLL